MIPRPLLKVFAVQIIALFAVVTILTDYSFAQRGSGRGGRGGGAKLSGKLGGFNRRGPASGGNFVSRPGMGIKPARPGSAIRPNRPGKPGWAGRPPAWDRPGGVHRPGRVHHHYYGRWDRRDRWDRWEERRDDWRRWRRRAAVGAGIAAGALAIGAIISASQWNSLGCTPQTIVVGGVTFYRCGPNWYERVYEGSGDVTYIVVNPPAGY